METNSLYCIFIVSILERKEVEKMKKVTRTITTVTVEAVIYNKASKEIKTENIITIDSDNIEKSVELKLNSDEKVVDINITDKSSNIYAMSEEKFYNLSKEKRYTVGARCFSRTCITSIATCTVYNKNTKKIEDTRCVYHFDIDEKEIEKNFVSTFKVLDIELNKVEEVRFLDELTFMVNAEIIDK